MGKDDQARLAHSYPEEEMVQCGYGGGEGKGPVKRGLVTPTWVGLDQALSSLGGVNPHSTSSSISSVPTVHQLYSTLRNRKG